MIRELVKTIFASREPVSGVNPDEAVAYGAAIQVRLASICPPRESNRHSFRIEREGEMSQEGEVGNHVRMKEVVGYGGLAETMGQKKKEFTARRREQMVND